MKYSIHAVDYWDHRLPVVVRFARTGTGGYPGGEIVGIYVANRRALRVLTSDRLTRRAHARIDRWLVHRVGMADRYWPSSPS